MCVHVCVSMCLRFMRLGVFEFSYVLTRIVYRLGLSGFKSLSAMAMGGSQARFGSFVLCVMLCVVCAMCCVLCAMCYAC